MSKKCCTFALYLKRMAEYVATIGFFDGVHLGHQFVISQLKQVAESSNLLSAVITFERHPRSILHTDFVPQLLTTFNERVELLRNTEINEIFAFNFELVKDLTAEDFMRILYNQCGVKILLMGYDHHFGSDRLTNFSDYKKAAENVGLELMLLPQHQQVSSTIIRNELLAGNVENANLLLGYSYTISGVVAEGKHIGQQIGFPTANIALETPEKLIPKEGVYEVKVALNKQIYRGILNIGTNPTVAGKKQTLEVHILDFNENVYGQPIAVSLLRFIREDIKFATLEELKSQIKKDIAKMCQ